MTIERWMPHPDVAMTTSALIRHTGPWVKYEEHAAIVEALENQINTLKLDKDAEVFAQISRESGDEMRFARARGDRLLGALRRIVDLLNKPPEFGNSVTVLGIAKEAIDMEYSSTPIRGIDVLLLTEIRDLLKEQHLCGHGTRGFCPFCLKSEKPG